MIQSSHPFFFLLPLFQREGISLEFSKYVYTPDSLSDEREIFQVEGEKATTDWINAIIAGLRSDQELALHSKVNFRGKKLHIPMIDLSLSGSISAEHYVRLSRFITPKIFKSLGLFSSGRSFHAYSSILITQNEWLNFMGRLLLVNPKDHSCDIIDSRWIGHRLIGGYSSLRWSNNSGLYLQTPQRVESIHA